MNTTSTPTPHPSLRFATRCAPKLQHARHFMLPLTLCALTMLVVACGQDDVQSAQGWGIEDAPQVSEGRPATPTLTPEVLPRNLNPEDPNLDGGCGVDLCPESWGERPTSAASCQEVLRLDDGEGLRAISTQLKLYDERGRFVELRERGRAVLKHEYDERGLLVSTKSFRGRDSREYEQRYVYNDVGQLIESVYGDDDLEETTRWTYDELGRVSSSHKLFTSEGLQESSWRFYRYEGYVAKTYVDSNDNGRFDVGVDEVFTDYTYDADGKLLSIKPYTEAFGAPHFIVKYHYNEQDQLIAVVDERLDDGSSTVRQDFSYDSQGRLVLLRSQPDRSVSVDGQEVLIRDRLELKRTDGAVTQALIYGSVKQEPVVSLQLSGSMCERSLLAWRQFLMSGLIRACGSSLCVERVR